MDQWLDDRVVRRLGGEISTLASVFRRALRPQKPKGKNGYPGISNEEIGTKLLIQERSKSMSVLLCMVWAVFKHIPPQFET
jgi:hypothetical protein